MVAQVVTRSTRSRGKNKSYNINQLSKAASTVEDVDMEIDTEGDSSVSDADIDAVDSDDDDYDAPGQKRKLATSNSKLKKSKTNRGAEFDFEENDLYKALSDPNISPLNVALRWVSGCSDEDIQCVTNLVNLLLRCCGCTFLLQPHDMSSLDSANETMGEITIIFKDQKTHEFPFISNNKDLRFFRANVIDFFKELVSLSHAKGLLYLDVGTKDEDDSLACPLFDKIFTWFLTLSTCPIRPLRYVATTILLTIQTELCKITTQISNLLETHQKQLSGAMRAKRKQQSRINSIETIVSELNHQQETIVEYSNDIINVAFIPRVRDVDPLIRQECCIALGDWILDAPDIYFTEDHLSHFSWLLSDPVNSVRAEVTRTLGRIYKHAASKESVSFPELRLFSETSKDLMVNMVYKDSDSTVRSNSLQCLQEMIKLNYLNDPEQILIALNLLKLTSVGLPFSKVHNDRIIHEIAKLVQSIHIERYRELIRANEDTIDEMEDHKLDVRNALKIKALVGLLEEIYDDDEMDDKKNVLYTISKILYLFAFYRETWNLLIEYLVSDQAIDSNDEFAAQINDFFSRLQVNSKSHLLTFIHGALASILGKKKADPTSIDHQEKVVSFFTKHVETLYRRLMDNSRTANIFISIWATLLTDFNKPTTVSLTFMSHGKSEVFQRINDDIFAYYTQVNLKGFEDQILLTYQNLFKLLSGSSSLLPSELNNDFLLMCYSLVQDVKSHLNEYNWLDDQLDIEKLKSAAFSTLKFNIAYAFIPGDAVVGDTEFDLLLGTLQDKILPAFSKSSFIRSILENGDLMEVDISVDSVKVFMNLISVLAATSMEVSNSSLDLAFEEFFQVMQTLSSPLNGYEYQDICKTYQESQEYDNSFERYIALATRCNDLQTLLKTTFVDLLLAFKSFYDKHKENSSYQDFIENFENSLIEWAGAPQTFTDIFLFDEAVVAKLKDISLDKQSDESVYLLNNSMSLDDYEGLFYQNFSNCDEIDNQIEEEVDHEKLEYLKRLKEKRIEQTKQVAIWEAENRLCVFTVKILTLYRKKLLPESTLDRIQLNKDSIGGLFGKLVLEHLEHLQ